MEQEKINAPRRDRPPKLSENHRRSISISLRLLDKSLCQWEQWAKGKVSSGVMYQQRDTLSRSQKTTLLRSIAEVRKPITRIRDDLQLEPETPSTPRLIVGQATVLWEMLAELNGGSLQGYGQVSRELANYIDPKGRKLSDAVNQIAALCSGARC